MTQGFTAFQLCSSFKAFLVFLCFWYFAFEIQAQVPTKEKHSCAAARISTTPALLADGITSVPHRELMRQYDVHWYKLDLNLERNSKDIRGNVIFYASAVASSVSQFAFELHPNFTIQQVLLDGVPCTVRRTNSEVVADLPFTKGARDKFQVQVFYAGLAPSGASAAIGNGFNTATAQPWGQQVSWSLSEPFAASEWFPVKQILADKADSVTVWVTTDISNKVGSNGLLQRITPLPNQKHRYEWKSNFPIAYYLISVAVGQYEEYSFEVQVPGASKPVLVQNYLYPGALATFKTEIDRTGPFLQLFSELYGVYPFHQEKYGHSMAPLGGGMEHQTMTTQSTFEFTLTAHELAHQWWGDKVTNADWSHIWLNEGFASYSELLALERFWVGERLNWLNKANQNALVPVQGSVFVKDSTNVSRIFNSALSYDKGSLVLHMLRHALRSDALFFRILQSYRQGFKYKVATTRDFQKVVERESGRTFQYFFDQWVYGEGYPIFDVAWAQEGSRVYIRSKQSPSSPNTSLFTTEVEYKISTTVKDTVVRVQHFKVNEDYTFNVAGTVTGIEVDPNQWLLNAVSGLRIDASIIPLMEPEELVLYPNPTSGQVTLKGRKGLPAQILIYDMVGRNIRNIRPTSSTFSIAELGSGAYFLKLIYTEESILMRILKL